MTVALLLISDGREDYLQQTLDSVEQNLPDFDQVVHIDDTRHELGFAGAIQAGWDRIQTDYVLHLECDFTFNRPIPVDAMRQALEQRPYLVQMALLRQPWNQAERAAGGVVQQHPDSYTLALGMPPARWLEHARFYTTNPSLYPRWIVERGWPQTAQSEGLFGLRLFAEDPARRSAFWGSGEEWCHHVGDERAGHGY